MAGSIPCLGLVTLGCLGVSCISLPQEVEQRAQRKRLAALRPPRLAAEVVAHRVYMGPGRAVPNELLEAQAAYMQSYS